MQSSLRLWPGLVLAALVVGVGFILPAVAPTAEPFGVPVPYIGMLGGAGGGAAIALWWLLFSRAPWVERLGVIALAVAALLVTHRLVDASIANGMMGFMLPFFALPVLGVGLVVAAALTRNASVDRRRAALAIAVVLVSAVFTLIRTGGITGEAVSDLHWRWTPTPEERLLAEMAKQPAPSPPAPIRPAVVPPSPEPVPNVAPAMAAPSAPTVASVAATPSANTASATPERSIAEAVDATAAWSGFRGTQRDSVVRGVQINTDWSANPPTPLWRRAVGPGWSSFAVSGDFIFTQEQRGEHEVVSCYRLSTGEPVWSHRDPVRFWESNGGAGPRATPTLSGGRVFTQGATGVLNALDQRTGARVWSRNAATDTGVAVPDWGLAGSPLVVGDVVIVAVSGQLAGYDAKTGATRWLGEAGGGGYSSPHLWRVAGEPQVLLARGARTISVRPADGSVLWQHSSGAPAVSIVQPSVLDDNDLLIASGDGMGGAGIRRVSIAAASPGTWTVTERWTSRGLKPYFNDFVVHNGHAFGFDASILASIDLTDGARKWKGGRYGHGQMLLLADQDLLLVLAEDGDLALVSATPDKFTELARIHALEGKTWNHPVLVGDVLLVRNGEEMAAFRLKRVVERSTDSVRR